MALKEKEPWALDLEATQNNTQHSMCVSRMRKRKVQETTSTK